MEEMGFVDMLTNLSYINKASRKAMRATVAAFVVVLMGLVWASPAWANTIQVRNTVDEQTPDNGLCSLRDAIFNANDNGQSTDPTDCEPGSDTGEDTIVFDVESFDPPGSPATIKLELGPLPAITDPAGLTIAGQTRDGDDVDITISGNDSVRVFEVANGAALTVKNLTVTHGLDSAEGGGILNQEDGTLTVTDSTLSENSAPKGGGLANKGGTLTVANSKVSDNRATGQDNPSGGGIYTSDNGTLTVTDSTVSDNSATDSEGLTNPTGGGIANVNGTLTVSNSTFSGNSTLSKDENSPNEPPPQDETFGGGIYTSDASQSFESRVKVSNSTFSGNSASDGGGIFNDLGEIKVSNTTFSENSATGPVGDNPTIPVGATITANIFQEEASTFLTNTIVANTTQGQNCFGLIGDGGYNIAYGDDPDNRSSCDFPTSTSKNNTNPKLDPDGLQDNGGPTETIALESTSPAIDQGNSPDFTTDQRGEPRPHDFANVENAPGIIGGTESDGSDIGAFELQELVNQAPVASDDAHSTNEDKALNVAAPGVLANDTDADGDTLSAVLVSGPNHGSLNLSADGSFVYTPAPNYNGTDSFTYKANDGSLRSQEATVRLTVNPVNDAPSFTKGADQTVNEDAGAQTVNGWATAISAGPADESTQTLSFTATNDNNALFSVQPKIDNSGTLTYTPAPDAFGNATVSITLKDNGGTANGGKDTSATQTFVISVTAVNDAPKVVVTAGGSCDTITTGTIKLTVTDADNSAASLTLSAASDTQSLVPNANLKLGGSGANRTLTIITAPKRSGTATVTVTVSDGQATSNIPIKVRVGTDANETLNGTADADLILGRNGNDAINGLAGNDLLCGGNGVGTMSGGLGDDTLDGANGNDVLQGDAGKDILRGSLGNDRLTGGVDADSFSGGPGTDTATDFNASEGDTKDNTIP
jgi:VCBS repeat-containing protein